MANCGNCGSNVQLCNCVFNNDASTTFVIGNGSLTAPIAFNKTEGPTPRPLGDMGRVDGNPAITVPINTNTLITFTDDLTNRVTFVVSVSSGMVDLVNSRLVCQRAGKYLVGGTVVFAAAAVAGNNIRTCRLSMGVPAGANIWAADANQATAISAAADGYLSPQALVQMAVNDYIEMWVFSSYATTTVTGPSAIMYAIWMDD